MDTVAEKDAVTGRYPTVSVSDARATIATLVDRVNEMGERVIITRHGDARAAVIPIPDLLTLEGADAQAQAAMDWPGEGIGVPESAEPLGQAIQPPPEDTMLEAEIEQLVRETTYALLHNPGLQDVLATFADRTRAEGTDSGGAAAA
ncbi:type II toxin-antitoxin system Phd/YefM family antitoxin [Pacificoceanicola onchidii]|uniref:type II toxin-antitoxin system Phd/YefM family antitoxin n=1 Tax=Pacificoceanicola onchidii TaxID=2562685 RepID=UPI0010A659F1|nr:type II toxin-antitoxin system Phd/YefM family antitoxin [Pacificoceanicola onchidii]